MKKYYLQNMHGHTVESWFENDEAAFKCAAKRNKADNTNWKAYDERGNLIYGICIYR